jgi:hypothetical protein
MEVACVARFPRGLSLSDRWTAAAGLRQPAWTWAEGWLPLVMRDRRTLRDPSIHQGPSAVGASVEGRCLALICAGAAAVDLGRQLSCGWGAGGDSASAREQAARGRRVAVVMTGTLV